MTGRHFCFASVPLIAFLVISSASGQPVDGEYRRPSAVLAEALREPRAPAIFPSPNGEFLLLGSPSPQHSLTTSAVPVVYVDRRLINLRRRAMAIDSLAGFAELKLFDVVHRRMVPLRSLSGPVSDGKFLDPIWSGDGRRFAAFRETVDSSELWIGDVDNQTFRRIEGVRILSGINTVERPCNWLADSRNLMCYGRPTPEPAIPTTSPTSNLEIVESAGGERQFKSYHGLLRTQADFELFSALNLAQPVIVSIDSSTHRPIGRPGLFQRLQVSPDGRYLLAVRYSDRFIPNREADRYAYTRPRRIEVTTIGTNETRVLGDIPIDSSNGLAGEAPLGPRQVRWAPRLRSTLVFVEQVAQTGQPAGNPGGDRIMRWDAPFDRSPVELFQSRGRLINFVRSRPHPDIPNFVWLSDGRALVEELAFAGTDLSAADKSYWIVDISGASASRRISVSPSGSHRSHGTPFWFEAGDGSWEAVQVDGALLLHGTRGEAPFVDGLSLETGERRELFRGGDNDAVEAAIPGETTRFIVQRTDRRSSVNLVETSGAVTTINSVARPASSTELQTRTITYRRRDGVSLRGRLVLPPNHRGERLPTIIWGYPQDFATPQAANRAAQRESYYDTSNFVSYMAIMRALPLLGYAVLEDASVPIVGGNDTAARQMTDSLEAAADALVDQGIADPNAIAIFGHSYGGTMVGTVLANSRRFAAGIALNGAFNHTNTPFVIQSETRTYWQAPEVYRSLSPLLNADRITTPLLIMHGERDVNWASTPAGARNMYQALAGLGRPVRLVMFPYEEHAPGSAEAQDHMAWEIENWLARYLRRGGVESEPPQLTELSSITAWKHF